MAARPDEEIELNKMGEREAEARQHDDEYRDEQTRFAIDFERYRDEISREYGDYGFEIEHNGKDSYKVVLNDPEEVYDYDDYMYNIQEKINYRGLRDVVRRLDLPDRRVGIQIPSLEFLRDNLFLEQIDLRMNEVGVLIGLKYKPIGGSRYIDIVVKKDDRGGLRFLDANKAATQDAIREFVDRVKGLDEIYSETPSGITEEIVNQEVFGSEHGSKISDEQIWERNEIRDETRRGVLNDAEEKIRDNRDMILNEFQRENNFGFGLPPTEDGTNFADHVVFLTDLISNMDWYEDEGWPSQDEDLTRIYMNVN